MSHPLTSPPRPTGRVVSLAWLTAWGLWLRVAAADLVQWYAQRKGVLCVFPDTGYYWLLAGKLLRGEPYEVLDYGDLPHFALRTPGYPLFLAACRLVFGPWVLPVQLVQAAVVPLDRLHRLGLSHGEAGAQRQGHAADGQDQARAARAGKKGLGRHGADGPTNLRRPQGAGAGSSHMKRPAGRARPA